MPAERSRGNSAGARVSNPGIEFEREIAKLFRDHGFEVIRGAASKGKLAGMDVDLVISKVTPTNKYEIGVALMQMKRSKRA